MRRVRIATALFPVPLLALAFATGIATARPATVGASSPEASAAAASPPRHHHPLAMPFFSFKSRK